MRAFSLNNQKKADKRTHRILYEFNNQLREEDLSGVQLFLARLRIVDDRGEVTASSKRDKASDQIELYMQVKSKGGIQVIFNSDVLQA